MFSSAFSLELLELLSDLAFVVNVALALFAIVKWKKLVRNQKMISLIVFLTLVNHTLTWILMSWEIDNNWVFHFYTPLLFLMMTLIYSSLLSELISPWIFKYSIWAFLTFSVINGLFIQSIKSFNSNTVSVSTLLFVVYSLTFFYRLIRFPAKNDLRKNPMIWFNVGVLTYYTGTLMLFFVVDSLIKESSELTIAAWVLNAAFNLILLCSYGLSLYLKTQD
uniref:hypothetical protein n=3 Tax=Roseivirga sp. TaxID=1964215 RepID=UPI0040487971